MTALYRKYRPQDFNEVVGQEAVVRTLTNAITHGQVRQAYLFAGPRGTGKTSLARILAKSLNCVQGPTVTPDKTCHVCKAIAAGSRAGGHFRLRYDTADGKGTITLRRAGRLHHLNIGAAFARRRVLAIVDEQEVTVVALDTGEILSTHLIEPDRRYWRNQRRDPGRWPGSQATS